MALKRNLSFGVLLFLTINGIIGTGIFFSPSIAASIAGINSLYSWIISIILSLLIATVFAELAGAFPKAGGVYEYTKRAFGKTAGFFVGWLSWTIANVLIAMLVVGALDYIDVIWPMSYVVKMLAAFSFVILINYISFKGIEISGKLLLVFSMITISVLVLIGFSGSTAIDLSRFSGLSFNVYTSIPIMVAMFYSIETFFGWESISFLSEETKDPRKNLPKALIIGTVVVSILTVWLIVTGLASVPIEELGATNAGLLLVAAKFFSPRMVMIISGLIFFNIMGTAASWIISTPRLIYAMSKDKVLPESFSDVHKKNSTPHKAIMLQTLLTFLVIGSGSYMVLLKVAVPLAIIMYSIVILALPKLRKTYPNVRRFFKLPFASVICGGLILVLGGTLIVSTTLESMLLGMAIVALGIPLYIIACLGYHEKITRYFADLLAGFSNWMNKFMIEKDISHHILNYLSDVTIERVLDLGCGVGVVTNKIAKEVIPLDGKVYGVDFSKRTIDIAKKTAEEMDIKNVEYLNENFYNLTKNKEVNKKLSRLDAVVGVGVLGYIERLDVILEEARKRLKENGKIYFIDYDYPGHFLDKPLIENTPEIEKFFKKQGFRVRVWRQKKLFWTYVHIYGIKI